MRVAEAAPPHRKLPERPGHDYRTRSGFPKPAHEMRGIARTPSGATTRPQARAQAADSSPARTLMQASEPASASDR
jgi:hypothetical protein